MKAEITQLVTTALNSVVGAGEILASLDFTGLVERTSDPNHGDFACNIALKLAKILRRKPRELAAAIVSALPPATLVSRVEIAGPGFINFYLDSSAYLRLLAQILTLETAYGNSTVGHGTKILVEFVSANPTGPLHVGHGRGAAYGSVVAALLEKVGFTVQREYYVNDAGRQMDILATSIWLRYLELCGENLAFPANGYKGDYVWDIAATLHREHGDAFRHAMEIVFAHLPPDEPAGGDKEVFIDALIDRAKQMLGNVTYRLIFECGLKVILDDIRNDLELFGVHYDTWYSERGLIELGAVERCVERLRSSGHVYTQNGALWFRSTAFGDDKDRVLVRENGLTTYFASDIAYHLDKLERGFEKIIDVWGADHHGYIPRVKAALQALGAAPDRLTVKLIQFAILYRNGERVQMATRSGEFVTLRELRKEVGRDAARFFYVMRACEQHLDFDLGLAKSQSTDNPVYYVQYAHARIHSVFRQAKDRGLTIDVQPPIDTLERLVEPQELVILRSLSRYPEVVESAALYYEPHQLTHYLRTLASEFHVYYNVQPFLVEDRVLRDARLAMIRAIGVVLKNGLNLLGVVAPESM